MPSPSRLIRDHAAAAARALLEIVENCVRQEERRDALLLFRAAVEATLLSYERKRERKERKLPKPSNN